MRAVLALAALQLAVGQAPGPTQPWQLHLAYAGSDISVSDGMTVSWATGQPTATSTVRFGLTPDDLSRNATGAAVSYLPPAAQGSARYHHHVQLTGLTPRTVYYYQAGDSAGGWSGVHSFRTAPALGSSDPFPVVLPVFGDMGVLNSDDTMADLGRVLAGGANFTWHLGDIAYADDAFLHLEWYENDYDSWMQKMSDQLGYMQGTPHMVMPGNHEAECHAPECLLDGTIRTALGNFSAYNARFRMPFAASNATSSMWWSMRFGSIHFVNVDTETDFPGAATDSYAAHNGGFGDQLAWLQADLARAAADREAGRVSWILVGGHRPIYSRNVANPNGKPSGDTTPAVQKAFEPLFYQYGVDVFLCGHEHSAESIWPVFNSTHVVQSFDNPPYTTYQVVGSGGNVEGHTSYADSPDQPWNRFSDDSHFGIGRLEVHNASALTFTFRNAADGSTLDSWTLVRDHAPGAHAARLRRAGHGFA